MEHNALSTLILVRHGQSEWNLANRFTGWWDVDLTEKGVDEARAAGRLHVAILAQVAIRRGRGRRRDDGSAAMTGGQG